MHHRGTDKGSSYVEGRVGLGARCSKVDSTAGGIQPLCSEDKNLWLVCDGRIYNHKTLRRELEAKGHRFSSDSDVEVILHLYEEKGTELLHSLRGMFAFVLWDKKRDLLFGARDRFGIKPLYYCQNLQVTAFASEVKALLKIPGMKKEVDEKAFIDYLSFQYVPETRTMCKGIFRMPPAHYFIKSRGENLNLRRYWQLKFSPQDKPLSYFVEGIREKLQESVRLHLPGSSPRATFLSSGVDSAIIAALLSQGGKTFTFSVGYEDEKYSELQEARETASFLNTEHREYVISPREFIEQLPALIWYFDEPVADPAGISLYFAASVAGGEVPVVLSGEGADEVFGGYGIYREPYSLRPIQRLPSPVRSCLNVMETLLPSGIPGRNFLHRGLTPLERRFLGNAYIFTPEEKRKVAQLGDNNPSPFEVTLPLYQQTAALDDVSRMQYIDLNTWMPGDILVKADRMPAANSLELRVPFLDHQLFEFAAQVPPYYRIKGGTTKFALREAFKDLLPREAVNRPKRGFPVPTRNWMRRKDFKEFFLELLNGEGGKWFNKMRVKQMLEAHAENKVDVSRKLWTILIFLLWHEVFLNNNYIKTKAFQPAK